MTSRLEQKHFTVTHYSHTKDFCIAVDKDEDSVFNLQQCFFDRQVKEWHIRIWIADKPELKQEDNDSIWFYTIHDCFGYYQALVRVKATATIQEEIEEILFFTAKRREHHHMYVLQEEKARGKYVN